MTLTTTARNRIQALLNQTGGPLQFSRRRWTKDRELAAGEVRGAVFFHRERAVLPQGIGGAITHREHLIAVQVVTAVAEPDEPDDVLEGYRAWMVAQLGGTTLDGLVHSLEEGETSWETADLQLYHGAFTTLWSLNYQTHRLDLTRPS